MCKRVIKLLAANLCRIGALIVLFATWQVGCLAADPPLHLAKYVDVTRMYGGWHLIATIPNWFEKGLVAPYTVYSRRPDGDIQEEFHMQKGSFDAPRKAHTVHDWVRPETNGAHWRVQVFWPINLPFLIIYVDPQYRYVLYGEENRKLGWIYSRQPTIPNSDYKLLLKRFAENGYDPLSFRKFVQTPKDIGKPEFWSDGISP